MKARRRKTHFVPKVVYKTAFAGVVPLCVAGLACSSSSSGGSGPQLSVACGGFCAAVAQAAFVDAGDAGDAADAASTDDAATDSPCYCCQPNYCGVGVAAFADSSDTG